MIALIQPKRTDHRFAGVRPDPIYRFQPPAPARPVLREFSGPGAGNRGVSRPAKAPVMSWNAATGDLSPLRYGSGTSLPGYTGARTGFAPGQEVGPYRGGRPQLLPGSANSLSPLAKALIKIGLGTAGRTNPLLRALDLGYNAFTIAYGLIGDGQWGKFGEDAPPGWQWPKSIDRFQVSCGGGDPFGRWNAYSVRVGGSVLAFRDFQCHVGPGDGTGWDVLDDWDNHRLYIPADRDAVYLGPAPAVADWWIRTEEGVLIDRTQVHGPLVIEWGPGESAKALPLMSLAPPPAVQTEVSNGDKRLPGEEPLAPYERPAVTVVLDPDSKQPPPKYPDEPHVLRPPYPNEREIKTKTGKWMAAQVLFALYDATTEAKDIVDILYSNLGKKCKGAKSMSDKSYCVWKNLDTLNVEKAMLEIVANHYEDKLWGRVFGPVGKHTPFGSMHPASKPVRTPY